MIILSRILSSVLLLTGLFFIPWGAILAGIILAAAVFVWYIEGFLIGLTAAAIADVSFWKIFLILFFVVLVQEKLRSQVDFSKPILARLWLWLAGILVGAAAFFIFI